MFKYLLPYIKLKSFISSRIGYVRGKLYLLHVYLIGNEDGEYDSEPFRENKYVEFAYWLGDVIGYGFLINIPLWVLLDWRLTPLTILSYGITWYLIARFRGKL